MASLIINATAGLASAVAPSITALIICRVIGGLGIGGSIPTVFTLGAEIFSSNHRGKMLSYIARYFKFICCHIMHTSTYFLSNIVSFSFWMVGAIFTSTVGWIMLGNDLQNNKILPGVGWRLFAAVCVLPALLAIAATHWYIPESPRYLINKARFSDAVSKLFDSI
jgi:VNT family MFS transporter (synaptic vesicle glycoprotein 2)